MCGAATTGYHGGGGGGGPGQDRIGSLNSNTEVNIQDSLIVAKQLPVPVRPRPLSKGEMAGQVRIIIEV